MLSALQADAAGRGDQRRDPGRGRFELAVDQHVCRRERGVRCRPVRVGDTVVHAERRQQFLLEVVRERLARHARHDLARHDVQQVVVRELGTKARCRLEVRQRADDFRGRCIAVREHQQVAGAERQAAAMGQQVADREFPCHPRVAQPKFREVIDDAVVESELAVVDEQRKRRSGERLRHRTDLKQRVFVHLGAAAGLGDPVARGMSKLAVVYDRHRHARRIEGLHGPLDGLVDGLVRRRRRQRFAREQYDQCRHIDAHRQNLQVSHAYLALRRLRPPTPDPVPAPFGESSGHQSYTTATRRRG